MYAASPASGSGAAGGTSSVDGADFYAVAALWFPDKWRCHKSVFLVAMLAQALRAARVAVDAQSRWWEADEAAQAQALEVSSPPCCAVLYCRARQLSFVFMLAPAPSCCAALWCCASCCVGVCVGSTVHSLCQVHTCKPAPVTGHGARWLKACAQKHVLARSAPCLMRVVYLSRLYRVLLELTAAPCGAYRCTLRSLRLHLAERTRCAHDMLRQPLRCVPAA